MKRYLMCEQGAAQVTGKAPEGARYLDTVTVGPRERYRLLRSDGRLWAEPVHWPG